MMAFARNDVPVGPAGVDEPDVVRAFRDWELVSSEADPSPGPSGPLRKVPRRWYRLIRHK